MKDHPVLLYLLLTSAALGSAAALLWPALAPEARRGLLIAFALAWPVQVGLFAARERRPAGSMTFFSMWVLGTLVRLGLIAIGATLAWRDPQLALPLMVGLAGALFAMLLLEGGVRMWSLERGTGVEAGR